MRIGRNADDYTIPKKRDLPYETMDDEGDEQTLTVKEKEDGTYRKK